MYYEYKINDNAYFMTYYHTQDDGTTSVNTSRGSMLTTTTVMCDIPDLLTLGDMAYPIIYNYTIALSNNRENFATVVTNETRLVWQSDWYWPECVQEALFLSKVCSYCVLAECSSSRRVSISGVLYIYTVSK